MPAILLWQMPPRRIRVTFSRTSEGQWLAVAADVRNVRATGRSLTRARDRVRDLLADVLGGGSADEIDLEDLITLPGDLSGIVRDVRASAGHIEVLTGELRARRLYLVDRLVNEIGLSRRDAAELAGVSFQRIHQLAEEKPMTDPLPVEYTLEIYMPSDRSTVAAAFTTRGPFMTIAVGDVIDPRGWEDNQIEPGFMLRVTQCEHWMWSGRGRVVHKIGVHTKAEQHTSENVVRRPR